MSKELRLSEVLFLCSTVRSTRNGTSTGNDYFLVLYQASRKPEINPVWSHIIPALGSYFPHINPYHIICIYIYKYAYMYTYISHIPTNIPHIYFQHIWWYRHICSIDIPVNKPTFKDDLNIGTYPKSIQHPKWKESFHQSSFSGKEWAPSHPSHNFACKRIYLLFELATHITS